MIPSTDNTGSLNIHLNVLSSIFCMLLLLFFFFNLIININLWADMVLRRIKKTQRNSEVGFGI